MRRGFKNESNMYYLDNPVNAILLGIIMILLVIIIVLLVDRTSIVEISDDAPLQPHPNTWWMKLQNEGSKYVYIKDGKVCLKIKKS